MDQFLQKANTLLGRFEETIDYPQREPSEQIERLVAAERRVLAYVDGDWARECMSTAPESRVRYERFRVDRVEATITRAREQRNTLCTGEARDALSAFDRAFEPLLEKRDAAGLAKVAAKLRDRLTTDQVVAECDVMFAELEQARSYSIPTAEALSRNIDALGILDRYAPGIAKTWQLLRDALASDGSVLAPDYLTDARDVRTLRKGVESCVASASRLREAGVALDLSLISVPIALTLGDIEDLCSRALVELDGLPAKVATHNASFSAHKADWEKHNVVGRAMRRTFDDHRGRVPLVEPDATTGAVKWTYREVVTTTDFHNCRIYVFDADGTRLRDLRVTPCI